MNVLSLFDGISAGQVALERAGIKVDKYYASEIDRHAISVTLANYPNTVQLGDVTKLTTNELPKIDLLIGGSPCTNFSFSGKRQGMVTTCNQEILTLDDYLKFKAEGFEFTGQSYLFWEYVRVLKEVQPKYFLLENVVMTEHWKNVLTSVIGVEPILINSALVSAQSRKRLYWTNIPNVTQPVDKGIMFKDIVESGIPITVSKQGNQLDIGNNEKAGCIMARDYKGFGNQTMSGVAELYPAAMRGRYIACMIGRRVGDDVHRKDYDKSIKIKQFIEQRHTGKSNCLTTVQKDNIVIDRALEHRTPISEVGYRNLTIKECERLQTFPEGYVDGKVSKTQGYKALGNSWTVDVVAHIFGGLKCN